MAIATLVTLLSATACLGADAYSFDTYLAERGGCDAQRQILDKRLKEVRLDVVSTGKASQGQVVDLFGQPAAEWTEEHIQAVLTAFRRCEEQILRRNRDDRSGSVESRKAKAKDYEVLIARGALRIEQSLREIIAANRTYAAQAGAAGSKRAGREGDTPEPSSRDGAPSSLAEPGRVVEAGQAGEIDRDRLRRAEANAILLQEARRIARDRERDRMRAERAPSERGPPPAPSGPIRNAEAFAFAPRPVMDRQNCTITREGFDQVQRGMSLDRVEAVIGCRGTLSASSMSAELGKIETHSWDDRRTTGTITVQFLNSLVYTKSQVGLN